MVVQLTVPADKYGWAYYTIWPVPTIIYAKPFLCQNSQFKGKKFSLKVIIEV